MRKSLYIAIGISIILGCSSKHEFEAKIWKEKGIDGWMTDVREKMVDDLIESDTLIGMNQLEVIALLGQPESASEMELKYLIREKYSNDIDPDYVSYLEVNLNEEGIVLNCKIHK